MVKNYLLVYVIDDGVFASQSRSIKNAAKAANSKVGVFAPQSRSIKDAAKAANDKVDKKTVTVIRFFHSRRDWENIPEEL